MAAPPITIQPTYDNWLDAPQTAGDWSYRDGATSVALFGEPGQGARFGMECNKGSGQIRLVRAGSAAGQVPVRVRTETADRMLTAAPAQGDMPTVTVTLDAGDRLLDAMALTKGRFAVEAQGLNTLYLPAWAEVTRVIEDCR